MRSHPLLPCFILFFLACGAQEKPRPAGPNPGFQWIHDDYPQALAAARAEGKPLFIDMWAPWCHTCLSMKHHVFTDPGLSHHGNRFVWLAIDTDKEQNTAVVAKFPPGPWPKFYVVDPTDESIQVSHDGSASVKQLRDLFDQGETAYRKHTSPQSQAMTFVKTGDQLRAMNDHAGAAAAYGHALGAGAGDMAAAVAVKRMAALVKSKDEKHCKAFVEPGMAFAEVGQTASGPDFASLAMVCASPEQLRLLVDRVAAILAAPEAPLSVDDRSDAMRIQRELFLALHEKPKADALAAQQYKLLLETVRTAPDAGIAMTYNWPLCEVAVYLEKGQEVLPLLEKSVEALPTEYDPPYRLAWLYEKLGQRDKARALADLALSRAYGPRKQRIQDFRDGLK